MGIGSLDDDYRVLPPRIHLDECGAGGNAGQPPQPPGVHARSVKSRTLTASCVVIADGTDQCDPNPVAGRGDGLIGPLAAARERELGGQERLPGAREPLHGHHDVLVHGSHDQHIDTHVPPSVSPC